MLKVIGQQKVELDFFKEHLAVTTTNAKRQMINKGHSKLSIVKQCSLLGIHRSELYYKTASHNELNLKLMQLMDEQYTRYSFMGARRMHTWLTEDKNYKVNQKRIERLYYQVMGLRTIMPSKHTTKKNKVHKVYSYLLRNLTVEYANQVWATDITYIPIKKALCT